jgi:hypothetical protein
MELICKKNKCIGPDLGRTRAARCRAGPVFPARAGGALNLPPRLAYGSEPRRPNRYGGMRAVRSKRDRRRPIVSLLRPSQQAEETLAGSGARRGSPGRSLGRRRGGGATRRSTPSPVRGGSAALAPREANLQDGRGEVNYGLTGARLQRP